MRSAVIITCEYSHPPPSRAQGWGAPSPSNNVSSLSTDHSGVPVKALSPEAVHLINWAAPWKILMLRCLFLFYLACSSDRWKKSYPQGFSENNNHLLAIASSKLPKLTIAVEAKTKNKNHPDENLKGRFGKLVDHRKLWKALTFS